MGIQEMQSYSLLIIPLILGMPLAYGIDWADEDFDKARLISTDAADFDATLTDYPLYANITSIDLGTDTQADCDDIAFYKFEN